MGYKKVQWRIRVRYSEVQWGTERYNGGYSGVQICIVVRRKMDAVGTVL